MFSNKSNTFANIWDPCLVQSKHPTALTSVLKLYTLIKSKLAKLYLRAHRSQVAKIIAWRLSSHYMSDVVLVQSKHSHLLDLCSAAVYFDYILIGKIIFKGSQVQVAKTIAWCLLHCHTCLFNRNCPYFDRSKKKKKRVWLYHVSLFSLKSVFSNV